MHSYPGCGFTVLLENGYVTSGEGDTSGVSYIDLQGLHRAIVDRLTRLPGRLSRMEFRFLRREAELSQTKAAELLGVTSQTVSLWERGESSISALADTAIRALAREKSNLEVSQSAHQRLGDRLLPRPTATEFRFKIANNAWTSSDMHDDVMLRQVAVYKLLNEVATFEPTGMLASCAHYLPEISKAFNAVTWQALGTAVLHKNVLELASHEPRVQWLPAARASLARRA